MFNELQAQNKWQYCIKISVVKLAAKTVGRFFLITSSWSPISQRHECAMFNELQAQNKWQYCIKNFSGETSLAAAKTVGRFFLITSSFYKKENSFLAIGVNSLAEKRLNFPKKTRQKWKKSAYHFEDIPDKKIFKWKRYTTINVYKIWSSRKAIFLNKCASY